MSVAWLLLVATGIAFGNAQISLNKTREEDLYWLTANVKYKFQTPPDVTT